MMSQMIIMSKFSLLLFFSSCFVVHCTDQIEGIDSKNEASILLSIKANLIDPLNHLKDWNLQENATSRQAQCNWTGIQCNSNGLVEALDLSYMNLTGTVSDSIQGLTSLRRLNLCCNGFSSPLPKSLSNITSLQAIDISQNFFINDFPHGFGSLPGLITLNASGNNFSGDLPEDIVNSTMLESLDLRGNFFGGSIPRSYKSLVRLKFLGLSGNNLTGNIPGELGELTSLETMVLGYNQFEGGIPLEFGNLTNLKYLDLAITNLGGSIPVELGKLEKLNTVYLYQNNLEGKIPPELGNMTALQFLDLSDNMLYGEIPYQIAQAKNLQLLNLMTNQLSGSVPSSIEELTRLEVLELWNNSLTGPLPANLGQNSPLQWVDVSSNSISGPVPTNLCDKGNLSKLILFNNAFSGPIPTSLSACASLVRVRIQNNLLNGTIPSGFGKLSRLQRLELGNNSLTGQIPYDLSASSSLSFVDLSRNRLQSSLPSPILSMPNLQKFMASGNHLFGQIPDQFQDCPNLSALDLSSNYFTGTIPSSIASCARLVSLNLRNNRLNGSIPNTLAVMPVLSVLDLSNNSLTGNIPQNFGDSPALETFNVSYNNLVGPVPLMLKTINSDDFIGNPSLCGGGLLPPCSHNAPYTIKQHKLHIKHVMFGSIVGFLTLLALVISVLTARSLYRKWKNSNCFEERRFESDWPWRLMAFQRLGFDAQDILGCIKESNVIGMGSTGTVYKAEIPRSNTIVAVKKLWRSPRADLEAGPNGDDLSGEVNLLAKLRHRNIVRLFGFLHNDSDSMIIYEYMQNGSLGEALHGKQRGKLLVDWVSRYNVALGVAQGLAYLHHDCIPSVIHRDIKSNNILLDANADARIADFGLAKLVMTKNETVSVVAGSYGYIAPEYGYTLKVDEKSDIYSYGVVLMELVTGKPPLDPIFGESIDVVRYICGKMRDNAALDEVLDPSMGTAKHVREEMLLVLRIAVLCTAKSPKDRPSMRDVLTMLGEAKPRRKCTDDGGLNAKDIDKPVFTASPR